MALVRTSSFEDPDMEKAFLDALKVQTIEVRYKGKHPPKRNSAGAAGYDFVYEGEDVIVEPGQICKITFGFGFALPPQTVMVLYMRSSFGLLGLSLMSAVIDADYRGNIGASVQNTSKNSIIIDNGTRFCQGVIHPFLTYKLKLVEEFSTQTERGEGGFGSTGLKD